MRPGTTLAETSISPETQERSRRNAQVYVSDVTTLLRKLPSTNECFGFRWLNIETSADCREHCLDTAWTPALREYHE